MRPGGRGCHPGQGVLERRGFRLLHERGLVPMAGESGFGKAHDGDACPSGLLHRRDRGGDCLVVGRCERCRGDGDAHGSMGPPRGPGGPSLPAPPPATTPIGRCAPRSAAISRSPRRTIAHVDDQLGAAYELLDAGDGRRLERFGDVVVDRPAPGVVGPRLAPGEWHLADARYERRSDGDRGAWEPPDALPGGWIVQVDDLSMELRLAPSGQVGFFPEHVAIARWAAQRASVLAADRGRPAVVLNLFAHTGLATLLLARAGAAVSHVDASRPAIAWARRNATLSGMEERPVRWLVDDAARFVAREVRRGRRYDGAVLDPPTFGRAPSGAGWSLEAGLSPLLRSVRGLLAGPDAFVACTAHATGLGSDVLERTVVDGLGLRRGLSEARELELRARSGSGLAAGWAVLVSTVGTEVAR